MEESSGEDSSNDHQSEDGPDCLKPGRINLGLSQTYSPRWQAKDAFREFFQNLKDGIIASFEINPRAFRAYVSETPASIVISCRGKHSPELLGFIKFDKKAGTVLMSNFMAKLKASHFIMGESSKREDNAFAGCHGEGFKLGALVMCRLGYSVEMDTDSCHIKFGFHGPKQRRSLHCNVRAAGPKGIEKEKAAFAQKSGASGFRRGPKANMWEDTTVRIGKPRTGSSGKPIPESSFRRWLKVVLDLHGPADAEILRTRHGDLILAPDFKGNIYLKGLLVVEQGLDGRDYAFGYNFLEGYLNRDRERLTNLREEARMLTKLWEAAIGIAGHQGNDPDHITDLYIDLFQNNEKASDISMADEYAPLSFATTIWMRLKSRYEGSFFYSEKEADEPDTSSRYEDIITKDLLKEPVKLGKNLWKVLRRHSLVRTAHEQKVFNFSTSPPIAIPDNAFCSTITRALRSSLKLRPALQDLEVDFVKGEQSTIDVLFNNEEKLLKVHDKWLDFSRIHEDTTCDFSQATSGQLEEEETLFCCDHIIHDLLRLALDELRGPLGLQPGTCSALRNEAAMRLQQLPRDVQMSAPESGSSIVVSWAPNHSRLFSKRFGAHLTYNVILHKMSTCADRRGDLLYHVDDSKDRDEANVTCQCPSQEMTGRELRAAFSGLDPGEHYFPMISRAENMAFFGLPPPSVSPAEAAMITPEEYASTSGSTKEDVASVDGELDSDAEMDMSTPTYGEVHDDNIGSQSIEPTPRIPIPASAAVRSPPNFPSRHPGCANRPDEASRLTLRKEDEEDWHAWHTNKLPRLFSHLTPERIVRDMHVGSTYYAYEFVNPETGSEYFFQKNEYAHISTVEGDYVILVRDIWQAGDDDGGDDYLVVTKYSLLRSTYPFCAGNDQTRSRIHESELILHFETFNHMGTRADAQVLPISSISSARELSGHATIDYVVQPPEDAHEGAFFCRFAVCTAVTMGVACFTPVATDLLGYQHRWPRPTYSSPTEPVVLDLSPGVLGTSEGFSQANYNVLAAVGFDKNRHYNWKVRYPSAELYDGSLAELQADMKAAKPHPLAHSMLSKATVGILAGSASCFRLTEENTQMPSLEEFLRPLAEFRPNDVPDLDYFALLLPPAILHGKAVATFSSRILDLLEKRKSIHLGMTLLRDNGLPVDGSTLVVIASPLCSALPWDTAWPSTEALSATTIREAIADLELINPRATPGTEAGFSCLLPPTKGSDDADARRVWNHNTSQRPEAGEDAIVVDAGGTLSLFNGPRHWIHPVRQDLLTIREIARVNGFPDDFVFYGSNNLAYESLSAAVPPVLARNVAQVISRAIADSSPAVAKGNSVARGRKRARLDVEDNQTKSERSPERRNITIGGRSAETGVKFYSE